jgi:hypothetical protein
MYFQQQLITHRFSYLISDIITFVLNNTHSLLQATAPIQISRFHSFQQDISVHHPNPADRSTRASSGCKTTSPSNTGCYLTEGPRQQPPRQGTSAQGKPSQKRRLFYYSDKPIHCSEAVPSHRHSTPSSCFPRFTSFIFVLLLFYSF